MLIVGQTTVTGSISVRKASALIEKYLIRLNEEGTSDGLANGTSEMGGTVGTRGGLGHRDNEGRGGTV